MRAGRSVWIATALLALAASAVAPLLAAADKPADPSAPVSAQPPGAKSNPWFVYSAKFLCGDAPSNVSAVKPGSYATTINLHKWVYQDAFVHKKAVISVHENEPQFPYGFGQPFLMCWDMAVQIDCRDIQTWFPPGVPFIPFAEGYVSIMSPVELDVWAVYSVMAPNGEIALDVEPVPGRMMVNLFEVGEWPPDWPHIAAPPEKGGNK